VSNRRGFSLIELLVYSAVTCCLVVTVIHFTSIVQRDVAMLQNMAIAQTGVYAGLDSLARACAQAPGDLGKWFINEPQSVGWVAGGEQLWFVFKDGNLVRISCTRERLGKCRMACSSLLIPHVKGSFHVCSAAGSVLSVEVRMCAELPNSWTITRRYAVRSGRIV
jgi:hypothetical protein